MAATVTFEGRTVLVTGAGRGMGREHARLFASLGAQVVVADAGVDLFGSGGDESVADSVARELCDAGWSAVPYSADLASEEGARGAVRLAVERFGRIDTVVHNAGFTLGSMPMQDESAERLEKQLAINTRAAFLIAQEAWPHFLAAGSGRIVLIGSTAMYGIAASTPYSTAKASYIGLCRALASEGENDCIHVNLVAPSGASRMAENMPESAFRTWFLDTLKPELVSPVVAWLAHRDCAINGETFVTGGGRISRVVMTETPGRIMAGPGIEAAREAMLATLQDETRLTIDRFGDSMKLLTDDLGFIGEQATAFAGQGSAISGKE
jgi:NAD(P)-dependent dehydrogenase (short-subunit alcohol dehydrogenase family)